MLRRLTIPLLLAAMAFAAEAVPAQPLQNPSEVHKQTPAETKYLSQVMQKMMTHRFPDGAPVPKGSFLVARVVIARDGRLLSAEVAQPSGTVEFDRSLISALRENSPYPPLPPEIPGASATFRLALALNPQ